MLHITGQSWAAAGVSGMHLLAVAGVLSLGSRLHVRAEWLPFGALFVANSISLLVGAAVLWRPASLAERFEAFMPKFSGAPLLLLEFLPAATGFVVAALIANILGAPKLAEIESARIVAHPILVLTTGLLSVWGPRLTAAGWAGRRQEGIALGRGYVALVWSSGLLYALLVSAPVARGIWDRLVPLAYVTPGLVSLSIVANIVNAASFGIRMECVGAGHSPVLVKVEAIANALRLAVLALTRWLGPLAVPVGVLILGTVRTITARKIIARHYLNSA